ncbi:MAG TPA: translocation/assembly module TamB domain-containing protein [Steroidobacteraceae bacterium]|nr:translocation/assembly module TamB domain-containing protein [Steroidobacteraceae bacterium]
MKRSLKILKIVALALGILLVVLVSLLAWVIYTEAGLQFAVARLPEKLGSVTLQIEDVRGTIAGGFSAKRVDVDHALTHVTVENGSARVNFWPLLVGRISVRRAQSDLTLIEVKKRPKDRPITPPRFLPRFLSISAEKANTRLLAIIAPNGRRVEFNDVSGAGIVGHKTIRIFEGNVIYGFLQARAIGQLDAADPIRLSGDATVRMIIEGQPEWRADAAFKGDLDKLPLTGTLQEPFRADLTGELLELASNFHWIGKAQVHNFDLQAFGGGDALGIIEGPLDVGGEMNEFHARGPLTVPGLGAGPFDVVFEGNYEDRVVNATHYEVTHRATGSHVTGAGTIETADNGPKLLLQGNWDDLRWPLAAHFTAEAPQIFSSPAGKYRLEGVWPYALSGSGDLYVPDLDPMTVAMRGLLHKDHLQIDQLDLGAFGGNAKLAGEARWTPAQSWSLAGPVRGLDPATLRPGFSGALDFELKASGQPFSAETLLDVSFDRLVGKLRGNAATGSGHVVRRGEDWSFDDLRFRAGSTALAIDGDIGASHALDLDFSLDADNLALIAEGARGELHARGNVEGTSDAPVIKLDARGNGIEAEGLAIDKLSAVIDVDWRGQRPSHANVAVSNLTYQQRAITQFNATLDGTTGDHKMKMDVLAGKTSLHLSGRGGFANGTWSANIGDLFIDDTANLNLQLDSSFALSASASSFKLEPMCLHGKVARLCADGAWSVNAANESAWNLHADAHNLPISTLTAGLTPKVEYQGTVNATAKISSASGAAFVGDARLDLVDAAIRHKLASGRTDVITFGSGFVTLDAEPAAMNAEVRLDAAERGLISGKLRADRNGDDMLDWPMRGSLQMATGELGFITLYVPDIDRASGHFDANLTLDGTLGRPSASGVFKLSNAELDLYQLNLALRAVEMEAKIVSNSLEFKSTAKAGAGTLSSGGKIEWKDKLPYGDLTLEGQNLRVVDVPEARIDASPDLDFHIAGREIQAKGEVRIPYARIQPADLTNAVLPSADERLVGPTEEIEEDPFLVSSDITMTLGDNVTIETYGLSGHITGSLSETTRPGEPTRGTGELQVKDGQYVALARKLDIERGRLIFNGGLIADPAIDIRAVKIFPDVKAGVNVRGSLREPRMSFFSEPSKPQSQIVSLLLAGGSLQTAQSGDRTGTGGGAQQEVAGQAAAILAAQLGGRLGIPDISVESDLSNDTSLVLGRYLSPRLYLSYGISLTESISTIKMRYTLDDHWTIKTEAGKERAADLVFTIEK